MKDNREAEPWKKTRWRELAAVWAGVVCFEEDEDAASFADDAAFRNLAGIRLLSMSRRRAAFAMSRSSFGSDLSDVLLYTQMKKGWKSQDVESVDK